MKNNLSSSLIGLNALICGSTSGIGLSTAVEMANQGANITLFSRNNEKLKKTIKLLSTDQNQNHNFLVGDFNNPQQIKNVISEYLQKTDKITILVNNSGGPKGGSIIDAQSSEFIETFNRHLICNHILTKALFSGMKEAAFGRIINIISTSVKEPIEGLGVSNTVRGAVASWAKTLSSEIGKYGITVNNILPGFTSTERLASLIKSKAKANDISEKIVTNKMLEKIPLGRFGEPEEIAKVISFLSSKAANYINGVSLAVDGGRLSSI